MEPDPDGRLVRRPETRRSADLTTFATKGQICTYLEGELRNGAGFVSEHGAACARLTVRASLLKADAAVAASALVYSTTWQSLSARIQRQHS